MAGNQTGDVAAPSPGKRCGGPGANARGSHRPLDVLHEILHVPVIVFPIVNHDDSQHAPNENLRLQNLRDGIDAYAAEMAELHW